MGGMDLLRRQIQRPPTGGHFGVQKPGGPAAFVRQMAFRGVPYPGGTARKVITQLQARFRYGTRRRGPAQRRIADVAGRSLGVRRWKAWRGAGPRAFSGTRLI